MNTARLQILTLAYGDNFKPAEEVGTILVLFIAIPVAKPIRRKYKVVIF